MDNVYKVIDKHIKLNNDALHYHMIRNELKMDCDAEEMIQSHAGAVTGLIMLKKELKGELEY